MKQLFRRWLQLCALCLIGTLFISAQPQVKIYLVGDSTVYTYKASEYPMAGWGQVFERFFRQGTVIVDNRAIGGRSSRMFYNEDRWPAIVGVLKQGDYVFIQFGHNDRDYSKAERYTDTADYKKYLRLFVKETRAKNAIPVLVSPMNMNTWNGTALREVFCENANDYRGAMLQVATELSVPFIDLEKKSAAYMKLVGQEYCTNFHFLGLKSGEYPNYPDGVSDGTHFQEMGALANARMVAEGIKELSSKTEMKALADALAPLHTVSVTANKASIGLITVSGAYPPGATVTLKVVPKTGETFEKWTDAKGVAIATTARYTFTMGDTAVTCRAAFKGGTTDIPHSRSIALPQRNNEAALVHYSGNSIQVAATMPIGEISLFTVSGKLLKTIHPTTSRPTIQTTGMLRGIYLIKLTGPGMRSQTATVSLF